MNYGLWAEKMLFYLAWETFMDLQWSSIGFVTAPGSRLT